MKITVTESTQVLNYINEDGILRCSHQNVTVEAPCCNGDDCGCHGQYSVYCNDCHNDDLTNDEADQFVDDYISLREASDE